MASKLEKVLEIEAADSYMKRPAGPMVTIEIRDVTELVGHIRIPSMAEGASTKDTVLQRILYSELPNQCRKCRRFRHHACACTTNKIKPQEGIAHRNNNPPQKEKSEKVPVPKAPHKNMARASRAVPLRRDLTTPLATGSGTSKADARVPVNRPQALTQATSLLKPHTEGTSPGPNQRGPQSNSHKDLTMVESPKSPSLPKSIPHPDAGTLPQGDTAPRSKLCFGISGLASSQALTFDAGVNPFASLGEKHREVKLHNKLSDNLVKGWSFQGRKKHAPKLASPRQDAQQSPLTLTPSGTTPRGKRGPTSSEVHHTYFTSLGIHVPSN
jgi:hypothetical protein